MTNDNSNRGLASADEETKERVARKGGEAVSQDREHMSEIGRKGGEEVSQDREHMAEIGRKGGESSHGGGSSSSGNQGGGEGRGFAGMSEEKRKEIASKGGQH
jgi:general stress protein YciG